MRWLLPLTLTLASCGGKSLSETPSETDTDADTDADADADTDADTDADSCEVLTDGNWGFNGDNFQGQASAQLIWDGSCTFTLQTWAPQGAYPSGGSVVDDQVTAVVIDCRLLLSQEDTAPGPVGDLTVEGDGDHHTAERPVGVVEEQLAIGCCQTQ